MNPVTIPLSGFAARQKTVPDPVAVSRQKMFGRFLPVLIVQAQLDRLGTTGKKRKIDPTVFDEGAELIGHALLDHAGEFNGSLCVRELS